MPNFRDALSHNVPIVDELGRPTPEFMAKWQQQTQINKAIPAEISTPEQVSAILDLLAATPGALLRRGAAQWQALNSLGDPTKFLNGAGAYAPPVPLNAKGQVLGTTGAALGALAPGADGQVLTADAAQALGLRWGAASGGGGDTVIADLSPSGTGTVSVASIPATFRSLHIVGICRSTATSAGTTRVSLQFNADTGPNYASQRFFATKASVYATQEINSSTAFVAEAPNVSSFPTVPGTFDITVPFYAQTTFGKPFLSRWLNMNAAGMDSIYNIVMCNIWNSLAAINRVDLTLAAGNWVPGTRIVVYGVH